ncbi:Error-prone repair protein ImuA [Flaviaesturariibacter aridisoli]|uniref:Error-prone repair protein ImuA n=2 Tax=Flaviaesturariibacter aridisoli TaxID=2545761 RepID=A0A4R4E004_9BACT|nr:Error-prone repair protein ImuA [Flaviaesturariibacter aridisoli]
MPSKADIFTKLRQEVLALQGFRTPTLEVADPIGLGRMNAAFPNGVFPRAALHEFLCADAESAAASGGFIAGLLSSLLKGGGAALWVGTRRTLYPPALQAFGIRPEQVLFLDRIREKDIPWALDEALKCAALGAVVGELRDLTFTDSRRFQLAIESSGVPLLALRRGARAGANTAVCRWQIAPLASATDDGLPGLGRPRWRVRLLKVRNGQPGSWDVEWAGRFRVLPRLAALPTLQQKAG